MTKEAPPDFEACMTRLDQIVQGWKPGKYRSNAP